MLPEATVLHVSHDIGQNVSYDKMIVMDQGRIAEQGSPTDLLSQPSSLLSNMVDSQGEASAMAIRSACALHHSKRHALIGISLELVVKEEQL